jgi:hypothetical protein
VTVVRIGGDEAPWSPEEDAQVEPGAAPDPPGFPLVLVTWRDAWFDFDEPDAEEARSDYLVTTVGFLARQGPRFVSVAQEVLPDGDGFRAITHIPVSVIESLETLRAPGSSEERDRAIP